MLHTCTENTIIASSDFKFYAVDPTNAVSFTDTIPYVEKSPILKSTLNCTVSKFLLYKRTEYINLLLKYLNNNRQHESLDWLNCTFFFVNGQWFHVHFIWTSGIQ